MADPVRFVRLNALPSVCLTDAIYFIGTSATGFEMYVTGNDAIPRQLAAGPPGADGLPGSSSLQIEAGEDVGGHRVVTADGYLCEPARANFAVGVTLGAAVSGDIFQVTTRGPMIEPSWSWVPDQPIFIGPVGTLTQTAPNSGLVRRIGFALTPTLITIDFQPAINQA